jgi:hypothetical protein
VSSEREDRVSDRGIAVGVLNSNAGGCSAVGVSICTASVGTVLVGSGVEVGLRSTVDIGFDYRVIAGQIMVRITIKAIKSTNRVMSDRKNPTRPITPLLRARRVTIPIETPLDTSLRAVCCP